MKQAIHPLKMAFRKRSNKWTFIKRLLVFVIFFILIERFTYFQTGGFAPYKIICSENSVISLDNQEELEAQKILNQPFYYLDKGVQFFAFISEDQHYVLKFIKHHRSSPRFLTAPHKIELRLQKIINSCQIAYHHLKEETGLIALHLAPNPLKTQPLLLFDNLGIAHTIDLNATSYLLQKRADTLSDRQLTKSDINALIYLIKNRYGKAIFNEDSRIRNFGFLESQAMEIDLGSFVQHQHKMTLSETLQEETLELKKWLDKYDPALSQYLSEKIQEI